ncbi:hypothetical protein BH10ACT6_BH10ACT6_08280 [soil metagenome]
MERAGVRLRSDADLAVFERTLPAWASIVGTRPPVLDNQTSQTKTPHRRQRSINVSHEDFRVSE